MENHICNHVKMINRSRFKYSNVNHAFILSCKDVSSSVADPGFDLRGGVDFVNGGGGGVENS